MAICKRCGAEKLSERPCPKCGGLSNRDIAEAFCRAMEMLTEPLPAAFETAERKP